ncbi:MAG: ATP phosphoribosyltransferase regulatory subunit, partial [Dehalococcoidia bacterium]
KARYEKNPMRLLDCKEERCQPIIAGAPRLHDYLCDECREHFERLKSYLQALKIGFDIDERLVRGLDYYTRTAFEMQPSIEGSQSALGGGGRYDGLIELLGGAPTPGIGFGSGVERLVINLKRQEVPVDPTAGPRVYIAHLTPEAAILALQLAEQTRAAGCQTMMGSSGRSLKAQLRHANAKHADFAAIIGAAEVGRGEVTLRDLRDHSERRVPAGDVAGLIGA